MLKDRESQGKHTDKINSRHVVYKGHFFYFIEVQLIYNVVLISAVQQSDSVIYLYILFHILFHSGLSQDTEYSSLDLVVYPSYIQ